MTWITRDVMNKFYCTETSCWTFDPTFLEYFSRVTGTDSDIIRENVESHILEKHFSHFLEKRVEQKKLRVHGGLAHDQVGRGPQRAELTELRLPTFKSAWFVTLTSPYEIVDYVQKVYYFIRNSNMYDIFASLAVYELTKEGRPHIHALMLSDRASGHSWSHAFHFISKCCSVSIGNAKATNQIVRPNNLEATIKYILKDSTKPDEIFLKKNNLSSPYIEWIDGIQKI